MSIEKERDKCKQSWKDTLLKIRHYSHEVQEEIFDAFIDSELEQPFASPVMWHKLKKLQKIIEDKGL